MNSELESIIEKLREFFQNDTNVLFVLLFGSRALGKENSTSDLDVAVFFREPLQGMDRLKYINRLSDYMGMEVDLLVLNDASPLSRHEVMRDKVNVLIRDRRAFQDCRYRTITDYQDYIYLNGLQRYAEQNTYREKA
jgi:hypothetical protein